MQLLRWALWGVCAAAAVSFAAWGWVWLSSRGDIYERPEQVPQAQAALVLGASVTSRGELSPVLQSRAQAALELYQAGVVQKILVTGDNALPEHNEVYPVGRYLETAGVPRSDIFLDYAGFDTYSSLYRARDVFGVSSVVVVSQAFHLPRALYTARSLGLAASGYNASAGERSLYLYNLAREVPATLNALLELAVGREPRYLGEQYPIQGGGERTWPASASSTPTTTPAR